MKLTPNLYFIEDEVQIIDALVDHNEFLKDFTYSQVKGFFNGDDYCFVIYESSNPRRFTMYKIEDYSTNEQEFVWLAGFFQDQIQEGRDYNLMRKAIGKLADMFYMAATFRAVEKKVELVTYE